jgi:hypothetical protein
MPVTGTPAFDAIALLEIDGVSFTSSSAALTGRAAFVNSKTGVTYGSTECRQWSKDTMDCLKALRASMEVDIAALMFETSAAPVIGSRLPADPGGIGEHAGQPTEAEPL